MTRGQMLKHIKERLENGSLRIQDLTYKQLLKESDSLVEFIYKSSMRGKLDIKQNYVTPNTRRKRETKKTLGE